MFAVTVALGCCADWLHVEGNKIVDEGGKEVLLRGLNWFGFETNFKAFHGLWAANLHTLVKEAAEHGFNVWRIPISAECIHDWETGDKQPAGASIDYDINPDVEGLTSQQIFDLFLVDCRQVGMKVFIDIHSIEPNNYMNALWGDPEYLIARLEWFANHYKSDDTIIGIDVKNEPHSQTACQWPQDSTNAVWDDSTSANNWRYVAGEAGKRILAKNPHLLIFVEGIQCYGEDSSWWGGQLMGVKDLPVDIGDPTHLVYSPHEYGPSVSDQPWFSGSFSYDSLYNDHWYKHWLYIHKEGIAPLLIGEWGGRVSGTNTQWMQLCAELIGKEGLHQTFWCLNPDSGDTGGLLGDDWKTWDTAKLNVIKSALGGKLWPAKTEE